MPGHRRGLARRGAALCPALLPALLVAAYLSLWRDLASAAASVVERPGQHMSRPAVQAQPQHRFLLLFSGHQGSSALADMLGQLPEVFVPGFEPLDAAGLSAGQKLAFMEAVFTFPSSEAQFAQWQRELLPMPGMRINRTAIQRFSQLAGKTVAGFKLRPYVRDGNSTHTALTGLNRSRVKALLHKYDVRLLVTLRRNTLLEALSWYYARELGIRQFDTARRQRQGSTGVAGGKQGVAGAAGAASLPAGSSGGSSSGSDSGNLPAGGFAGASVVNTTQLLRWLNYTAHVNERLQEAVAYFERPTLTLVYEDFAADPLAAAARAAAFVGADPARLQPSARFTKRGGDSLADKVLNLQELCHALVDTKHFAFMGVGSCDDLPATAEAGAAAANAGAAAGAARQALQGGRAAAASPRLPASGSDSAGGKGADAGAQQRLLKSWCAPADKAATTGWASLSDEECMRRVEASKAAAAARVREGRGTLLFKHFHKAGGSTLCKLAHRNMVAESAPLPQGSGERPDWDTNCVPYEAFLGPHPAVGLLRRANASRHAPAAAATGPAQQLQQRQGAGVAAAALEQRPPLMSVQGGGPNPGAADEDPGSQGVQAADPANPLAGQVGLLMNAEHRRHVRSINITTSSSGGGGGGGGLVAHLEADAALPSGGRRHLQAARWLGGACWFGFLTPAQLRVLPNHFRPLTFVASEGPLPDVLPLDLPFAMVTMLRHPLDRVLSSYRWWQLMMQRMPDSPTECRAYAAPPNATFSEWLDAYPSNWVTRELAGTSALYGRQGAAGPPELGAEHLTLAKQRLHYFAAVLIMERWAEAARVLRDRFGWEEVDFKLHRAGSNWNSAAERELSAEEVAKARAINALDLELYEYAVVLAAADEIAA